VLKKGFVYLVGAGPGRADLITVRGAEVLKKADCIIYDKLANPALLKFARADAEIVHVPKRIDGGSGGVSVTQRQINQLLVEKAAGGKIVVRLKGGDPCIFGRVAEELAVLCDAGIGFEIVPGITAGIAVSAYTGIMLTDRDYSSQVAFVTGREAEGKQQSNINWSLLAKFPGSVVFYMGMGNLDSIAQKLIENGMPEDTPAAVVTEVTFPTQRIVKATLARISETCEKDKIGPPAIIIIGAAADSDTSLNWFMKQPLFGKNIVLTRDEAGNADFAEKILVRGGNPVQFASINIKPLTGSNEFLQALTKFNDYNWIIFTSSNGVTVFFDALESLGKDARVFSSAKIAVIGSRTAEKLSRFGIKADFVPGVFTSEQLGRQLLNFVNLLNKKVLLLRSQIASDELVELLVKGGAVVDDVAVYTAVSQKGESDLLVEKISKGEIDWLTFASPSSVDGFFEQVDIDVVRTAKVRVASIGPVTSERLLSLGVNVDVTADEHTLDGLLNAIEKIYKL
jgi:uroporphyrinogen III methyltransferase/synthase